MTTTIKACYVITDGGTILVQTPEDNRYGFSLHCDDASWPGGFGIAGSWEAIDDNDPRITNEIRDRLGWILGEEKATDE